MVSTFISAYILYTQYLAQKAIHAIACDSNSFFFIIIFHCMSMPNFFSSCY